MEAAVFDDSLEPGSCGLRQRHLDFAVLRRRRQQLAVAGEGERQHRGVVHHELLVRLELQVPLQLARQEVPHLRLAPSVRLCVEGQHGHG